MSIGAPIVVWIGRFGAHDGYGVAASAHVAALRSIGVDVVSVDIEARSVVGPARDALAGTRRVGDSLELTAVDPARPIAVVVHDRPDKYNRVRATGRSRLVGFSYWETEDLPANWGGWMASMDHLLAGSPFNEQAFVRAGVPGWMIDVVGHPIDRLQLDVAASAERYRGRWAASTTVFLSLVSSMNQRRDLVALVESFAIAFTADDDVVLVLKSPGGAGDDVESVVARVRRSMPDRAADEWPRIVVMAEDMTREQLLRLHGSADCYVSCERGDGWDLPAMDSLAVGVPVVASDFGASSTFLVERDCYVVETDGSLVASDAMLSRPHVLYTGQSWPYLDPAAVATQLRRVHDDPDERRRFGAHAAERIRSRFDSGVVAQLVASTLLSTDPVDLRGNQPARVVVGPKTRGWGRRRHHLLAESPAVLEARLLEMLRLPGMRGRFGEPGGRPGLRAAVRFARAHRNELRSTPTGRLLASCREAIRRSVPRGMLASLRALSTLPELRRRFDELGGPAGVIQIAEEYEAGVHGTPIGRDAVDVEADRRLLWSFGGPFRTPDTDLSRLGELRDRHHGERVFVMGNGPSLLDCDLSLLADEFTFGVNKIHLLFDRIDWRPSYYTLLDWKMGAAMRPHVPELENTVKFFPERFRGVLPPSDETYWYWPRPVGRHADDQFEPDMVRGIPSRATVLMTAIQQAFHLGFREIYLVGVDAHYSIPATVKQSGPDRFNTGTRLHLESTRNDDVNHFDPRYFGEGARWHDPNVDDMQRVFRMMRKGVERHGGRLLNATAGGSLEVLERVPFESLFTTSSAARPSG